ncbi:DUF3558 domain-containing protein [Saccharopolyspora spinosa]|uniref:Uncharacterized protein DUF3558 n=1 Tax=Saccharopolyspora spinosa TaxID=60894 RepID=A0A2N3Y6E1_SACSN|nr:DUF3558 domain-containing protein [Saccharopolyspora spinosa]PKW18480.1 uncharacterized protein DUF3558 [Saccharopolyspora spinosa]
MSHARTSPAFAAVAVVALGVVGCTQQTDGTPIETTAPISQAASNDPGMPQVANPKNLEAVSDPCQLLTADQLAQLGTGGKPTHRPSAWGEDTCTWGAKTDGLRVNLAPSTTLNRGLTSVLRTVHKTAPDEVIDGYPMVTSQPLTYSCGIYVSTTSEDVFSLNVDRGDSDRPEHQDTCAVAKQVASMVLSNLPAKN